MKILFTPSARIQFLSALAYIRRDKPDAALRFRQRAETVLKRLLNLNPAQMLRSNTKIDQ